MSEQDQHQPNIIDPVANEQEYEVPETESSESEEENGYKSSSSEDSNKGAENDKLSKNILGCEHYQRDCKIQSPCCEKMFSCRFCHDQSENHSLVRQNIDTVQCLHCQLIQPVSNECLNAACKATFGKYFCNICKLFDNVDKQQFHCFGCGLCRAGGKDNFFHCEVCQMCLPVTMKESHKCIPEVSQRDCSICLEDLHTSRIVNHIPSCGHLIHQTCFKKLLKHGIYACPTCGICIVKMEEVWRRLEDEISMTPMPTEYANCYCYAQCNDCQQETLTSFHILGLKCSSCGSFNTARGKGEIMNQAKADEKKKNEEATSSNSNSEESGS